MSLSNGSLRNKRVVVTGATGFIGGRLAQRLAQEQGAVVTGAGRKLERVPFVSQAGVDLQVVELTDTGALPELVRGQDIVFHLGVASGTSKPETAERVNITAASNLVKAAAEAGVTRFVHVSTMAAYGSPDQEIIAEDHTLDTKQSALYGRTKALGEIQVRKTAAELGLELAVVRPGMVFGPRGRSWTINLFKLVQRGVPVIFGDGSGQAQPVYVDNLIDGMILTATRPEAAGEAFNFVDQPLPWRDLFAYYGAMCGRKPRRLPLRLAKVVIALFRRATGRSESVDDIVRFYTAKSVYPITKAERLLDYEPRITIEEGMKRTEEWLREAGYLRTGPSR